MRAAGAAGRVALERHAEAQLVCHCGASLADHAESNGHEFVHSCPFAPLVCECGWLETEAPRRALEAAEAWLACPCEEHRIAAARALLDARPVDGGLERAWLPTVPNRFNAGTHPTREGGGWGEETVGLVPSTADDIEWNRRAVEIAARLATPKVVRQAIQLALTTWALGRIRG